MDSFSELIQKITDAGDRLDFYGPQREDSVDKIESLLGINLPPSYRDFLRIYGGGGRLSGIWDNCPECMDKGCLLGDTDRMRKGFGLPVNYIPIQETSLGGLYCLDVSRHDQNGENPIVQFTFDHKNQLCNRGQIADSFGKFFRVYLEVRLEVILEELEEDEEKAGS